MRPLLKVRGVSGLIMNGVNYCSKLDSLLAELFSPDLLNAFPQFVNIKKGARVWSFKLMVGSQS